MYRAILFALVISLTQLVQAQSLAHIEIIEDVMQGTSMQIYLDFAPSSAIAGLPPLITAAEDVLVVLEPTGEDLSSAAFANLLANAINDSSRGKGLGYKARFREKEDEERGHDAVSISSPSALVGLYISPDSATHPNTLVTGYGAISFNPTFADISSRIDHAWPGWMNARLQINDQDPTQDPRHQVEVFAPGNLKFSFLSGTNVNQPVAFLLSDYYNPETIPQAFINFPGSLDIGTHNGVSYQNVIAVADAITGSSGNALLDQFFFTDQTGRLDFQISLGVNAAGQSVAAQAIIYDPTLPVSLAFTEAAHINAAAGKEQILPLGDDGGMQVVFQPGKSFDFYGTTYTAINVNANGFVTFGGPAPSGAATAVIDPQSALAGQPGIFAAWNDWDTTGVGVTYREFGNELRISWGKQSTPVIRAGTSAKAAFTLTLHLDAPAGTVPESQRFAGDGPGSIAPSAGSIFLDLGDYQPVAGGLAAFDSLIGISPGSVASPAQVPNRSFNLPFYPQLPDRPFLMQHDLSDAAATNIGPASGGAALYRNGAAVAGRTIGLFPTGIAGGTGYVVMPEEDQETDLQGANVVQVSATAVGSGPVNLIMVGYFRYLYSFAPNAPQPLVRLIDAGTSVPVATLNVLNLMTPNGPADAGTLVAAPNTVFPAVGFRAFEGAGVQIPANSFGPGLVGTPLLLAVTFPDGKQLIARQPITVSP
ncbi:MAG: hypothetical protein H6807_07025 [Planctomycetes bacterium]|nr:hypothetical protein [Planctomycetota bacterium]